MLRRLCALVLATALATEALAAHALVAQERGAAQLHLLVKGLTVTPRALIVGVRPEDDDGQLLAWLARGRSVETGYLSLTRGESGLNYLGTESGTALGAIRTQEVLAARRIDGAEQFFTRAYDFGSARNAAEAFKRWPRDTLLADIVTIMRSFRPHVLIVTASRGAGMDAGEYMALDTLVREAFDAAADTVRFPSRRFGVPWTPLKLYRHGNGLVIDPNELDQVLGRTFSDIAAESRAQRRTEGFVNGLLGRVGTIRLERVASRVKDSTPADSERSLFDGIDTTFARLATGVPQELATTLASITAQADSAQAALDLSHPERIVPHLARAAQLASSVRAGVPWCSHPAIDAAPPAIVTMPCEPRWLDLDAAIDLVRKRAADAALLAAGVSFEATIDRELVADGDTALATVTLYNYGKTPVTLADVVVPGGPVASPRTRVVPPDSSVRSYRRVTGLVNQQPWWIGTGRDGAMFPETPSSVDGLARHELLTRSIGVRGVAVPEDLRRLTDAEVSVVVAGVTVTTSLGPLVYHYADANVGVQDRAPGGVPPVTLEFDHSLEWIPAHKPINRSLRLAVKSFSDAEQTLALRIISPPGLRVDSAPTSITLSPHEQRDINLRLRGMLDEHRFEFAVIGLPAKVPRLASTPQREPYIAGFQTVQYVHLPPVRIYHSSGIYLQSLDINLPQHATVLYVKGVPDDIPAALKQLGIAGFALSAEDFLSVDISPFTTIVLGRAAYELHPELVAQTARLMEFVRAGGTLVVQQSGYGAAQSRVLPYPVSLQRITPERVASPDAHVTVVDPRARVLTWPNGIRDTDWTGWVGERASLLPTTADPHYTPVIETHDAEQPPNRNSILVTHLGKGTFIYTSLTFFQQIPAGVPGSMKLFVNLLSGASATNPPR